MSWDFAAYEFALSASIVVTTMVGMGTRLQPPDFWRVVRYPQAMVLTLVIQLLAAPPVALLLAWLLGLPAGVAFGLLFVTALPGGAYSNLLTHLGRGNDALSITATAVATLACPLTTVFVLKTYGSVHLPETLDLPAGPIVRDMLGFMALPLVIGMFARRLLPRQWFGLGRWCIRISMGLLAVYIVVACSSGRIGASSFDWRALLGTLLLAVATLWIGYGLGSWLRLPAPDLFTVAIEVLFRNVQLGLLIKAAIFTGIRQSSPIADGVLFVVLCYGVIALVVGATEVVAHRRGVGMIFGRHKANRRLSRDP